MALPALDPHPFGCPIAIATTPAQMPDMVTAICVKLRDVLFPTIHVINPSKGSSYPILSLHVDDDEPKARMVLFPGWETNRPTAKRRLDYGRQMTLLSRIHDAGVHGETIEQWAGKKLSDDHTEPFQVRLALTAPLMEGFITDMDAYLGDQLRMTVSTIDEGVIPLHVLRIYAPFKEKNPRVIFFPGWSGATERKPDEVGEAEQAEILKHLERKQVKEVPLEVHVAQRARRR